VIVEIPLRGRPTRFQVSLAGITYGIRSYWLIPANIWVLDISDVEGNLLAGGVAMVTGTDLLAQFKYLNIGGQLLVISDHAPPDADPPDWDTLNDTGHLYFIPDAG
jgi:hypothetical protein